VDAIVLDDPKREKAGIGNQLSAISESPRPLHGRQKLSLEKSTQLAADWGKTP
jgi:hypothetical protein